MYSLVYSEDAVRQLLMIRPVNTREKLVRHLEALANDPFRSGEVQVTDAGGACK